MGKIITRAGWVRILIITAAGAAVLPFTPGFKQLRDTRRMERFAEGLRPGLQADPRFVNVSLWASTERGGLLMVDGVVASNDDKAALNKRIMAANPPGRVQYHLDIIAVPESEKNAAAKPAGTPSAK